MWSLYAHYNYHHSIKSKHNIMRVLWIASPSCSYIPVGQTGGGYNGGGWVSSLQEALTTQDGITLGISFCMDGQPEKVEQRGVTYYPIPNHRKAWKDKAVDLLRINDDSRDRAVWPQYTERMKAVIADFRPDIIHIFGSELYQDLAALVAGDIPTVLHIQGLLSLSIYILLPVGISSREFIRSGRGFGGRFRNMQFLASWRRSVYREKAILRAVNHFIGRTDWDRLGVAVINPQARYHYGGEILRDVFYTEAKREMPRRTVITTTISGAPYKGFDVVLKVADILKREMRMDFEWNVYGNVDPTLFEQITKLHHADLNIRLRGVASAEDIHDTLLHSTLYVHPSYVENSPNSVCEAQLTGIPVVASHVGGTDSLVEHGRTGFLFPVTDPYTAAYHIGRLAADADLNHHIGKAAREVAVTRHDKEKIVAQLLQTYQEIIAEKE